jgi:apolipoprotein N-acyltransferase
MDWNEIQNFSSNIVFGILLFAMIAYWVNLSLFNDSDLLAKIGRFSTILLMEFYFLFFVLVG